MKKILTTTIFGTAKKPQMSLFKLVKDKPTIKMDQIPHYIFRVLRDDEKMNEGIKAKNPCATNTPEAHIIHETDNTQWISACACFICAVAWALKDHCRIAVIDTTKVDSLTLNFREGKGLKGQACNFAKSSQEILIQKSIPANAITFVMDANTVAEFLTVHYEFTSMNTRIEYIHMQANDALKKMREFVGTIETLIQKLDWVNPDKNYGKVMDATQKAWNLEALTHVIVKL